MNLYNYFRLIILFPILTKSCSEICSKCMLGEMLWLQNFCNNTICLDNNLTCNNSCQYCATTNSYTNCSNILSSSSYCSYSNPICGPRTYRAYYGNITTFYRIPKAALCMWVLDMRTYLSTQMENSIFLKIRKNLPKSAFVRVIYYTLPQSIQDLTLYKGNIFEGDFNEEGIWINGNIISIIFSTGTDQEDYPAIEIEWICQPLPSDMNLQNIIAIITVSVVLFLCCSCCVFCCFKFSKAWRMRNRRREIIRSRVYQVIPDNSMIQMNIDIINNVLPAVRYEKSLQEVGEPSCPICFDDFGDNALVRKTLCKHIFHASCIENWIRNNNEITFCPVCKNSLVQLVNDMSISDLPGLK